MAGLSVQRNETARMRTTLNAERSTLNRLRWRARRGLLENDLLLNRFLDTHAYNLDQHQAAALEQLLQLPDNDLLDLLLARNELTGDLNTADVRSLLTQLRAA